MTRREVTTRDDRAHILFFQDECGELCAHVRPMMKKFLIRALCTKHVHVSGNHLDLEFTHTVPSASFVVPKRVDVLCKIF